MTCFQLIATRQPGSWGVFGTANMFATPGGKATTETSDVGIELQTPIENRTEPHQISLCVCKNKQRCIISKPVVPNGHPFTKHFWFPVADVSLEMVLPTFKPQEIQRGTIVCLSGLCFVAPFKTSNFCQKNVLESPWPQRDTKPSTMLLLLRPTT